MRLITPKTNWKNGDFFNRTDYKRIKNNIEFLTEESYNINATFEQPTLEDVNEDGYVPQKAFFNNVVTATRNLTENYQGIIKLDKLKNLTYYGNQPAWDAKTLNEIESLHMQISDILWRQRKGKLAITLGGVRLG